MYGLSSDVDLSFLVGRKLLQVGAGEFQTILHFQGGVSVTIEGECELGGASYGPGVVTASQLLALVGQVVSGVRAVSGRHLELTFSDTVRVTVLESDGPWESFTIEGPAGVIVV